MGVALPILSLVSGSIGAIGQFRGQRAAGNAQAAQANYAAAVARNNIIIAERNAAAARDKGDAEAAAQRIRTRQLIGRQRTSLAGSGQVVDEGSALDLVLDTAELGKMDELTIRNRAEREALGFEAQASGFAGEAKLRTLTASSAKSAAKTNSLSTLLTSAGSVASKWQRFKSVGALG